MKLVAKEGLFQDASVIGTDSYKDKDFMSARRYFQVSTNVGCVLDQLALALFCIQAKNFDCVQKWWTKIVADNSSDHQEIVEEARNNLRVLKSNPEYVSHILDERK